MALLDRIAQRLGLVRQTSVTWDDRMLWLLAGGIPTRAGVPLSPMQALGVATVLACVRVISEGLAALPIKLRQDTDQGSELNDTHPAAALLDEPNGWQTWQEFCETMTMHAALTGNGFAIVQRGIDARPIALLPLRPGQVTWKQRADWSLAYEVTWQDGTRVPISYADMFHLRGPSWDAVAGMEILRLARESIGLAAAMEWTQAGAFKNGGQPSGVLSTEQKLDKAQAELFQEQWAKSHSGENAGRIAVLSNGTKFQPITFDFASAQTLEARKLQTQEIARAFRVFPIMIGVQEHTSTHSSAEQFFAAHAVHTLGPWATRWEQTLKRDLLTPRQRRSLNFKIYVEDMLRADAKSRAEANAAGIQNGYYTRNEVRVKEGLNRLPGLDVPLAPLNLAPGKPDPAPLNEPPAPAG